MADALAFLTELRSFGFTVRRDGTALLIGPSSLLTHEHRQALLTLLQAEEEQWERETAALAKLEPDWNAGPVQMVESVLVRWPDGTPAAALTLEEWSVIERWIASVRARKGAEKGCPHKDTAFWRRGPHIMERCSTCGANVRGAGRWVPKVEVADIDSLPWLPGYAPEPDLFSQGEEDDDGANAE